MRAVVQRTLSSSVSVEGEIIGEIGPGLTVLLGVSSEDTEADIKYLVDKILNLRIFSDADGKMNLSIKDISGELLVISQFTLYGDCRKGRRPSFDFAARPELARELYEKFVKLCAEEDIVVQTGQFQAEMNVKLDNHGPVTILIDSKKQF